MHAQKIVNAIVMTANVEDVLILAPRFQMVIRALLIQIVQAAIVMVSVSLVSVRRRRPESA